MITFHVTPTGFGFKFWLTDDPTGKEIGQSYANYLPGLFGSYFLYGTYINENYRGRGLGQTFLTQRLKYLQEMVIEEGIITMMVRNSNHVERHIAEKTGFKIVQSYNDGCICEKCHIYMKTIKCL